MSVRRHHAARPWPALILGTALLTPGCATLEWQFPPPPPSSPSDEAPVTDVADMADDPIRSARALAHAGPADAAALLRSALAEKSAPADALLFELGLVLLAPGLDDRAGARAAFDEVVTRHPDSPHRAAAEGLRALLDRAKGLEADNAALRDDLKRMMDIDLETQRQRRGGATRE